MKKLMKWLPVVMILAVLACLLPDCCYAYYGDSFIHEGLVLEPNSFFRRCLATRYAWPEGESEAVLRIPDTVDGYRVISLGGFIGSGAPAPFWVDIPDADMVYSRDTLPEDAEIEQYHLTIVLGKYVKETQFIAMDEYYHLGDNRFVQILVTIDPGENPYFGVMDGRLYCKVDGQIVEGFFYASDYIA